ncbi:UNVERIFIED_CONTAM: Nuclear pore complex protein [Sesamum radiatum]|uniref:Nuclear pore complex protein n=1 Tax=Sesamum radiatum TaxID=300843 RepID=A0AAW2RZ61_SESRA
MFGAQPSSAAFATPSSTQPSERLQLQHSAAHYFRRRFRNHPNLNNSSSSKPRRCFRHLNLNNNSKAIVDAYKEDPGNPKYAFKHLLFSVTEPQYRIKPAGVSDIMWAEAIAKLEGMESSKRERLWPHLVQGFKDLSQRLRLQDEVILSDSERLKMTQSNVKMLQRHFQAGTLPWIQRMQQKEQGLQRRLLRIMRIIEALEGKGSRLPLMKGEVELAEKLAAITRQLKGSGAELSRRVQNLLTLSRLQADGLNGGSVYLPGSTKIHEQSLADMQEVLQRQTEAIARLGNVLKRDMRDMEIIMAEDTEMSDG